MKRARLNRILLFFCILLSLIPLSVNRRAPDETNVGTAESGMIPQAAPAVAVRLDVPLLNQLDPPALLLGCEVTSLAMILQYNGMTVTKNELADKLPVVPIYYENGLHGNPNEGFVGDINGSDYGFCVYHGPIASLASEYVPSARIEDISGQDFDFVISALDRGHPVWVVTTTTFLPDDELEVWQTPTGRTSSWLGSRWANKPSISQPGHPTIRKCGQQNRFNAHSLKINP